MNGEGLWTGGSKVGVSIICGSAGAAMATRRKTLIFPVGLGVAMLVSKAIWFSSSRRAVTVRANEFASATENVHALE